MARPRNEQTPTLFPISKELTNVEKVQAMGFCQALGMTYYEAMMIQFKAHVKSCRRLGDNRLLASLDRVASEIVEAKSDAARVAILTPDEPMKPEDKVYGFQQYHQYTEPARGSDQAA